MHFCSITLVRHGNAVPVEDSMSFQEDMARPLTELGRRQVAYRARDFRPIHFQGVVASPAERCVETAVGVSGLSAQTMPELSYDPAAEGGLEINSLFSTTGYGSPAEYLNKGSPRQKAAMLLHAARSWQALRRWIDNRGGDFLVCGHAPLIANLAAHIATLGGHLSLAEYMLGARFGETHAVSIDFEKDGTVIDFGTRFIWMPSDWQPD